jgi:predicted 3-demethylubiquinone-9 3-methyltransferase (glyoxalase superfamily)
MRQVTTDKAIAGGKLGGIKGPTPCLTFKDHAEDAINFYVSLFPNSRIVSLVRSDGNGPVPKGQVLSASFQLDRRDYTAFDGGPSFSFTEGFSLMVTCETQEDIDETWSRLSEGGEPGPCGWLKDRFGVSWQVVPAELGEMLSNPAGGNTASMMQALLKMGKLEIATLRRAYESGS